MKKRIHVIINPASGKDEAVLNVLNDVFSAADIDWSIDITHKYGDAISMTKKAINNGVDIVAAYGGDGTHHELINGFMTYGSNNTLLGLLPGGTGNGFSTGLGIPKHLKAAAEILANSSNKIQVDVAKVNEDKYFMSRMYTGIEPDQQTDRESKNKYGLFAYAIDGIKRTKTNKVHQYKITIDGEVIDIEGIKCYVVNSGSTGVGISIGNFSPLDGTLDVFILSKDRKSISAAVDRFFNIPGKSTGLFGWSGKNIKIETTDESQPIWIDGEAYDKRTPLKVEIKSGALPIVVA